MNEIILFGETGQPVSSSCSSCSGCDDKTDHLCTDNIPGVTSEKLTDDLQRAVKRAKLEDKVSVEFRDIHTGDLSEYQDVKTLINLSFSFPIITVNKKIKYMGPFQSDALLEELKESLTI